MAKFRSFFSEDRTRKRKMLKEPKPWMAKPPITRAGLCLKRAKFWREAPLYGGSQATWDVLKQAVEAKRIEEADNIIKRANIIVLEKNLTDTVDENGLRYKMPVFVMLDPKNLLDGRLADGE